MFLAAQNQRQCGRLGSVKPGIVAMDQPERVRALNQQREFAGIPGRCSGACHRQSLGQHLLDSVLLRCGSLPGRVETPMTEISMPLTASRPHEPLRLTLVGR